MTEQQKVESGGKTETSSLIEKKDVPATQANTAPEKKKEEAKPNKYINPTEPIKEYCVNCKQITSSGVSCKTGTGTWLCAVTWCVVGLCAGLIPFFVDGCKDVYHHCEKCKKELRPPKRYDPCNPDPIEPAKIETVEQKKPQENAPTQNGQVNNQQGATPVGTPVEGANTNKPMDVQEAKK